MQACDALLAQRVEGKLRAKGTDSITSRIHVAMPKPRDNKVCLIDVKLIKNSPLGATTMHTGSGAAKETAGVDRE